MASPTIAAPDNPDSQSSTTTAAPPLPPPSTFDFLPPLHHLLSRLLSQNTTGTTTIPDSQDVSKTSTVPATATATTDPTTLNYTSLPPLEIQHLSAEASRVKIRVQKARQAVAALPDVSRGIEEQEEEIRELEARVEGLRGVLVGMGSRAGGAGDVKREEGGGDVEMAG